MSRACVAFVFMLLVTMACSLGRGDPGDRQASAPQATPSPVVVTATNSATPYPSSTPAPTATTQASSSGGNAPVVNCTPRADWPVYVVVQGDTLASIAQRTGSATAQLATANCLSDPDRIGVGQRLRVPVLPLAPTQTPVPTQGISPSGPFGNLTFDPYVSFDGSLYTLAANERVFVEWQGPYGYVFDQVEFRYYPDTGTGPELIGFAYPQYPQANAVSVSWAAPPQSSGRIIAVVRLPGYGYLESAPVFFRASQ